MADEEKTIEYIHERKSEDGGWVKAEEMIWRIPPEEVAVIFAAQTIRLRCMREAEANLKNYIHPEPMRLGGKIRQVEIKSGIDEMRAPFLKQMTKETGSPEAAAELAKILPAQAQWRLKKSSALQGLASIGWLGDVTKARPPAITKDTSSVDYEETLLPESLSVREEAAPSGYNKQQLATLEEAREIALAALAGCSSLKTAMESMGAVRFGELVFKTQSRLYGGLPDPELEERAKFEAMRAEAAAAAAAAAED